MLRIEADLTFLKNNWNFLKWTQANLQFNTHYFYK